MYVLLFFFLLFTEELREYFTKFGPIESINVKTDPATGRSRGFAFLVFNSAETIDKVNFSFSPSIYLNTYHQICLKYLIFFNQMSK